MTSSVNSAVLDRHEYTQCQNPNCSLMIQPKRPTDREMKSYTTRQLVSCFDNIREKISNGSQMKKKKIHLAFIGDSRIRNQFLNFIQVNTNYCLIDR